MSDLKKILFIRFSSIGDIVLTTPLIRCLKNQLPDVEIHFLTKKKFAAVLAANPYVDYLHTIEDKIAEVIPQLKSENFDHIIDLHKNLRSLGIRIRLRKPTTILSKINFRKWLMVKLKVNKLPRQHIVDRYFKTLEPFSIENDGQGLDYFIEESDKISLFDLPEFCRKGYIGIVIGGMHFTKILPVEKVIELVNKIDKPVVLLGGPEDFNRGEEIANAKAGSILNACGKFSLNQSASLVSMAEKIVTNDTGLMHIAAAFKKDIVSVWGNTIPEFGMSPYLPKSELQEKSYVFEVKNLSCRPCSKIGFKKCPHAHFKCMNDQDMEGMAQIINSD